jgi:chloramphenicol-sensitive protein RarD
MIKTNFPVDPGVAGALNALGAFLVWGLSPIFFRMLQGVPAPEILAHRVVWSVILMAAIVLVLRRPGKVWDALAGWRRVGLYTVTTTLVSVNWLLFIWAVNNDHIVQASLGYYINPLVNVVLGVLFLGERLNKRQVMAVGLAAIGVFSLVVSSGLFPWISLTLASTFGVYALLRKKAQIDPLIGLFLETALLTPVAMLWLYFAGTGAFGGEQRILLVLSGVITAAPLILFMYGAQRLKLSTIGLMQYLAPSLQLLIGVALYGEAFTAPHAVAFALIWLALGIYSVDALKQRRAGP